MSIVILLFSIFGQCDAILYDLDLDQGLSVFSSIILVLTKFVICTVLLLLLLHLGDNMPDGDSMELIDQVSAYNQCGLKIKSDLLGNLMPY